MGSRSPKGRGNFLRLSGPLKNILNHCCGAPAKRINNGISASVAVDCIVPDWPLSPYIVPCEKSAPAMRPLVQLLWPLVVIIIIAESDRSNLDDLEELDRLNGDVEFDEAFGSSWTQFISVNGPQRADDAGFLVNVEPPVTTRHASATVCCNVNASK